MVNYCEREAFFCQTIQKDLAMEFVNFAKCLTPELGQYVPIQMIKISFPRRTRPPRAPPRAPASLISAHLQTENERNDAHDYYLINVMCRFKVCYLLIPH